jgi:hypothetical protein
MKKTIFITGAAGNPGTLPQCCIKKMAKGWQTHMGVAAATLTLAVCIPTGLLGWILIEIQDRSF